MDNDEQSFSRATHGMTDGIRGQTKFEKCSMNHEIVKCTQRLNLVHFRLLELKILVNKDN